MHLLRQGNVWVGKWNRGIILPMAKNKFAERELWLFHLQQNVEILETHFIIHVPPKLLTDSSFLNIFHLYAHVNSEIKFIQAVSGFDRDLASSTAILSPQNRRSALVFPEVDHTCRPVRFFALIASIFGSEKCPKSQASKRRKRGAKENVGPRILKIPRQCPLPLRWGSNSLVRRQLRGRLPGFGILLLLFRC